MELMTALEFLQWISLPWWLWMFLFIFWVLK